MANIIEEIQINVTLEGAIIEQQGGGGGGGIVDGDKGDITVSSAGTQWTIDNNAVTNTKSAQMATKTYKGRTSTGTGNAEDVPVATLKTDLGLVKGDVGLGNVDNTSDLNKPISTATQTALDGKVDKITGKGLSTEDYTTVEKNKLAGIEAGAEANVVDSVAGKTGTVSLAKADVGLSNVDNTSDLNKPISTATQTALDGKQPIATVLTNTTASFTTAQETKLSGIATGAEVNVNADWDAVSGDAQILNKPTISGTNTGDQNLFSTIAVAGQSNVVADSTSDTLTLVAGSNITLTTNATNDEITIASPGGGGGGGYTDEQAQDAVGGILTDTTSIDAIYDDAGNTISFQREALTGAITASKNSNTTALGSFTVSQLNTAISDGDVATGGGTATGTNTGDQTFIAPRVQAVTSSATVTPTASDDLVVITAQAEGLTLANPTGTFVQGQSMVIRIKDNGTARTIAYGANYRAIGVTLPTTTVINKTTYLGCIYNTTDTKLDIVGVCTEA
jgi:hypothetical protein